MKRKRLFIAIPLPSEIKDFLIEKFQLHKLPGKQTPGENLHVTVYFLGETDQDKVSQIEEQIEHAIRDTPAFTLVIESIILKKGRFNSMIWAKIQSSQEFSQLVKSIRSKLEAENVNANTTPHITLSRLKKGNLEDPEGSFPIDGENQVIQVSEIELWQSNLGGKSPIYESIKKLSLKEAGND